MYDIILAITAFCFLFAAVVLAVRHHAYVQALERENTALRLANKALIKDANRLENRYFHGLTCAKLEAVYWKQRYEEMLHPTESDIDEMEKAFNDPSI